MVFLIKTLQLILCFALLIVLHEGGHFLFSKLFKVRVEKFCLFFDPWWSLKLFSWRGTDYHLGWLPLGGYVKIAGMIDESMDTEQLKQPVKPWEFRAKPAWQRLLIMLGGVVVNFLLALFIYAMVLLCWGEQYVPVEKMSHGMEWNAQAHQLGLRDGDLPLGTDAVRFEKFSADMLRDISVARRLDVLRQGRQVSVAMPGDLNLLDMLREQPPFMALRAPALIDSVVPGSPAARAGVRAGDRLVMMRGEKAETWGAFDVAMLPVHDALDQRRPGLLSRCTGFLRKDAAASAPTRADSARLRRVSLAVVHEGQTTPDTLSLTLSPDLTMGVVRHNPVQDYPLRHRTYGLLECFPAGCAYGWHTMCGYVSDLKYIFSAEGARSVGSFGTIGNLFPAQWDWQRFWELTAFISLMLAFMNVLPIPALDGGHVLFLLVEVITRRKPSDKFLERAQMVGMYLLLALMALAVFNDLDKFLL